MNLHIHSGSRSSSQVRPQNLWRVALLPAVIRRHPLPRTSRVFRAHASSASAKTDVKKTSFMDELRSCSMRHHTREQAPREGGIEAPAKPTPFSPTRRGYLQYLAESKVVYDRFEDIIATNPAYASLRDSGLERGPALAKDLEWFRGQYGLEAVVTPEGPGHTYARLVSDLAVTNPPAFMCHYYNHYFAHTAGGRMIGQKVSSLLLEGATLDFYKWQGAPRGDVKALLESARGRISAMAEGWGPGERQACLEETPAAFKHAGQLMSCMTAATTN